MVVDILLLLVGFHVFFCIYCSSTESESVFL